MSDVRTNLQILIEQHRINPTQLARETGVPQPTIWRILRGWSKDPDTATLAPIAKRFQKSIAQLRGELPLEEPEGEPERKAVPLPLISWVAAGRGEANDPYAPGAAEQWEPFEGPFSQHAFALRVRGDSMIMPDGTGFPEGCIIAVDPGVPAGNGDFIVIRFPETDEATFKQLVVDGPFRYLKPLNPRYPTIPIDREAQLCGVVTEVNLRRRFK